MEVCIYTHLFQELQCNKHETFPNLFTNITLFYIIVIKYSILDFSSCCINIISKRTNQMAAKTSTASYKKMKQKLNLRGYMQGRDQNMTT